MTEERTAAEVAIKSEMAKASSAHSRINIPLNLSAWDGLADDTQRDLLWFHQHILDEGLNWKQATEAIGYDQSTVFRALKNTYDGSYTNICKAIRSYKKIVENRGSIQQNEIVKNGILQLVHAGLDYALANNSITMIIGESRSGKTVAASLWREENNHGTSVMVTAPPYGGAKTFLRRIAEAVGVSKNQPAAQTVEAIGRAFNRNRILIIDEAHRLMPCDRRTNPTNLEILRDLHDATKCGLALIATQRLDEELRKSLYMYEQLLGRIGMPIRLPGKIKKLDWMPILRQYVKNPGERLITECDLIANSLGRLGILVETLKVASRIASKSKENLNEDHVFKAIALRKQMMGDAAHYAYKH